MTSEDIPPVAEEMPAAPLLPPVASPGIEVRTPQRTAATGLHAVDSRAGTGLVARTSALHRQFIGAQSAAQKDFLGLMRQYLDGQAPPRDLAAPPPKAQVEPKPFSLSLDTAPWLADHCPDGKVSVLPMTCLLEILAATAQEQFPNLKVVGLNDVRLRRWIVIDRAPIEFRPQIEYVDGGVVRVSIVAPRPALDGSIPRNEVVGSGIVRLAHDYAPQPTPIEPLKNGADSPDPYSSGMLFHGPAFQLVRKIVTGDNGADALVDARARGVPVGVLHPALIDAVMQGIADSRWQEWVPGMPPDHFGFPCRIVWVAFHGPIPREGAVQSKIRMAGTEGSVLFPRYELHASVGDRVFVSMQAILVMIKGIV